MKLFVFDVESIGLHGEGFAVAGGVYTSGGGRNEEFVYSCPPDAAAGEAANREWVAENVPKLDITHDTPAEMRDAFWREWIKAKATGAKMMADCQWPVEARFLLDCVRDDLPGREWDGPYPLHDIATLILACGGDPTGTQERESGEERAHHPLDDARQSARLALSCLMRSGE